MISEYDAFGPWIYRIDEGHEVPRLFLPYYDGRALLALKFPRPIERRDATPDMDLYDWLFCFYETELRIFERAGRKVKPKLLSYDDVTSFYISSRLLEGSLAFTTCRSRFEVGFNTVSLDEIENAVRLMRRQARRVIVLSAVSFINMTRLEEIVTDTRFINLLRKFADEGENILGGAYQPCMPLRYRRANIFKRLKNFFDKTSVANSLYLALERELLIIERKQTSKKRSDIKYSYSYTYLPYDAISGVRLVHEDTFKGLSSAVITTKDARSYTLRFSEDDARSRDFFAQLIHALSAFAKY